MKKLLFATALVFGFSGAFAQKQGYINVNDVISIMPETVTADNELNQFQEALSQQGRDLMKELNDKDSVFNADSLKYSPSMKELKRKDMVTLYQRFTTLQQSAKSQIQEKQNILLDPIQTKAVNAIKAVATENKYTYVFDTQSLIIAPPGDNLFPLVKAKLGIKDTPAAPATKPATKP
jgi:outer membrane protein